ncbi:hypothetical protein F5B19DRAFT_464805 [Rostrohypoxylon terebratum]|nr:hypothetical protein F5B19DRAFT_464805 [Rostrohypoxylon terebratum]
MFPRSCSIQWRLGLEGWFGVSGAFCLHQTSRASRTSIDMTYHNTRIGVREAAYPDLVVTLSVGTRYLSCTWRVTCWKRNERRLICPCGDRLISSSFHGQKCHSCSHSLSTPNFAFSISFSKS